MFKKNDKEQEQKKTQEAPKQSDEELEEKAAVLNAAINERYAGVIAEYTPKRRHKGIRIFLIVLFILAIAAGIVLWVLYSRKNEQFQTSVMDGGEFCAAYVGTVGGSEFVLSEEGIVEESARFAFVKLGGKTRFGRIYTPLAEGETELYTRYYPSENSGAEYGRFEIKVDKELHITYTEEKITEEEYREAAGLPPKTNSGGDSEEQNESGT